MPKEEPDNRGNYYGACPASSWDPCACDSKPSLYFAHPNASCSDTAETWQAPGLFPASP